MIQRLDHGGTEKTEMCSVLSIESKTLSMKIRFIRYLPG